MSRQIQRADYRQIFLLPPALEDWVGADSPVRFIREVVESTNLKDLGIAEPNPEEGGKCYAAELLLGVWLYGYWKKIRTTRGLERACQEDLGFLWLSGLHRPDHNALWRFWQTNRQAIRALFTNTVRVAQKLEMVGFVLQAIDGTKIEAAASHYGSFNQDHLVEQMAKLEKQIARLEAELQQANEQEDLAQAERLQKDLIQGQGLGAKVRAALDQMELEGPGHVHPQELEARRMKTRGANRFAYNAQSAVDAQHQIIVAAELTNQATDTAQLLPLIEAAQANTADPEGKSPPVETFLADAGYSTAEQLRLTQQQGHRVIAPLKATVQGGDSPYHARHFLYEAAQDVVICPQGRKLKFHHRRQRGGVLVKVYRDRAACSQCPVRSHCTKDRHGRSIDRSPNTEAVQRHRQTMEQPEAQALARLRAQIVEAPFAQIKQHDGFRRFTVRGLVGASAQWSMLCAIHNLKKIFQQWHPERFKKAAQKSLPNGFAALMAA